MKLLEYDLGIHADNLIAAMSNRGVVKIVGFTRSGKSTLSEILKRELKEKGNLVLLQNAKRWLLNVDNAKPDLSNSASVDPEIAASINHIEKNNINYWIIDDAEIFLAYASINILEIISRKIQSRLFNLVLVRNRFVFENAGWFSSREDLIDPEMS